MSAFTKALTNRSLTSKLEVERKFVPTALLKKHASETSKVSTITLPNSSRATLTRLPRKRITDKYYDRKGQLEGHGIWVRWRREQVTKPDGTDATAGESFWEAKIKQGGDFVDSKFVEVKGKDAIEDLMAEVGVGSSIYDLRFELGFMADRVSWAVEGLEGEESGDDAAAMTLVIDTMIASMEGPNGNHPKYMHHEVGELELEKTITTNLDDVADEADLSAQHQAVRLAEGDILSEKLSSFMATHPELFDTESSPTGKLTAYVAQKADHAARVWKANEPGRIANMSEIRWEREMNGK